MATCKHSVALNAVIYCQSNFNRPDGKTANGLVRNSQKYKIVAVIDSEHKGLDAGTVLGSEPNGIPIYESLSEAYKQNETQLDCMIIGMAPADGKLSQTDRSVVSEAISLGLMIVSGLHEFLGEDSEFSKASVLNNVEIIDIRRPKPTLELRAFTGEILEVSCPKIAVLGTDCAIGKRTTATIVAKALTDLGLETILVCTGQTGLIQGAKYGVALDAVPSQFCTGEMEGEILNAYHNEKPDVIIIEGQGALSHPAYSTSSFILRGSCPDAIILQHAPGRLHRCDFPQMSMPNPADEIHLIETFQKTKVIGLTLNQENLDAPTLQDYIIKFTNELKIPVSDPFSKSKEDFTQMILNAFPALAKKVSGKVL